MNQIAKGIIGFIIGGLLGSFIFGFSGIGFELGNLAFGVAGASIILFFK